MNTERIAVVLMNLGGPSDPAAIEPFLFNFFMDKNIIAAPLPVRAVLAKWISLSRGRGAALEAYSKLGGKSPLLENTHRQKEALEKQLKYDYPFAKVFVSMRYWQPRAAEVLREIAEYRPARLILLPLYPQFSTTTTNSSFEEWDAEAQKAGIQIPTQKICCYPEDDGFAVASADLIRKTFDSAPKGTRLLFSAHGLPEKIIRAGDPYQQQCEATARAIIAKLNIKDIDWQLCYQSRVGPLKWIGPSTEEALEKAAADKVVGVAVYPLAFVSEHVETLVEIEMEYRHRAEKLGIPFFARVPTVSTHLDFIRGLAARVGEKLDGIGCARFCPAACACAFEKPSMGGNEILNTALALAMALGDNAGKPIAPRLQKIYPDLEGGDAAEYQKICDDIRRRGTEKIDDMRDAGIKEDTEFTYFSGQMRKDYNWISTRNLKTLYNQSHYYSMK